MRTGDILAACLALAAAGAQARAESLRVRVNGQDDGAAVRVVVIAVGAPGALVTARTSADGTATLQLPDMKHVSVVVRSDTHGFRCFGPEEVATGTINVVMRRALRASGVALGRDGRPLDNATVQVRYRDVDRCRVRFDTLAEEQSTTEGGEFILRHIDASHDFEILLRHPAYKPMVIGKPDVLQAPLAGDVIRLTVQVKD